MSKTYIVVHGLGGSPEGHWQDILHKDLLEKNEKVYFPQFSDNEEPELENWLKELDHLMKNIAGEKVVVCHSLGVILWLHYSQKYEIKGVSDLLLVAPPGREIFKKLNEISSFSNFAMSETELKRSAKNIRLVASENDKYCVENAIEFYARGLNLDYDILPPATGHINIDSGYGRWESVHNWCYDTSLRLKK